MASQRRFDDDEVREILFRATEPSEDGSPGEGGGALVPSGTSPQGLTLAEIQEIALEAGIDPQRVARAAGVLAALGTGSEVRRFGVPIGLGHQVSLPRTLDDGEWDRLVVRLRDTFDAVGEVRREGSLRTWSNGNLRVLLEPQVQGSGARLRITSLHGASKQYLDAGVTLGIFGTVGLAMVAVAGSLGALAGAEVAVFTTMAAGLAGLGGGLLTWGRARARRWIGRREAQFAALGEEVRGSLEDGARRDPRLES